ncbi:polymorphic toxin-type HINT domain-containing protein, partial [Streptomyces rimosus]
ARAHAAAAEDTAHAAAANAAANKAEAAAAAANAAANKAESEAAATHAAAQRANAQAAEATAQEARAGIAAHESARLAGLAAMEANNALQAANRTKEEAEGAVREAAMARLQATTAVQASTAARSTAAGIADPANTAIELTAPFTGSDVDADFAAQVAKAALETGKEQVESAEAKAAEALKAAKDAEDAAKRANAEVAPAFKAAADAATSAANAARSSANAMKSAAQAADDGAKARAAAASADKADAQAQADAKAARQAANQAYADAKAAREAATAAEAEASRARGAAAEATQHANAAAAAATQAEHDASVAQGAAKQAESDAAAASKLADSAEEHAKSAESFAKKANEYAQEAKESAVKAEAYEREQERKRREESLKEESVGGDSEKLSAGEEAALRAAGITPEEYKAARELDDAGFLGFLKEHGAEILVSLLGLDNVKACFTKGDIEACVWTLIGALPWGRAFQAIKEAPAIGKAIYRTVTGIGKFIEESDKAKKLIRKSKEIIEKFRKAPCLTAPEVNSFTPETLVVMADGSRKQIKDIQVGQQVLATDPIADRTEARAVTDVIVGEGQKHLVEITVDTDGAAGNAIGTLTATEGHPFWDADRARWLDARYLKAGDQLRDSGGKLHEVVGIRTWTEARKVYNLSVAGTHTYYVLAGEASVLVHNAGGGSGRGSKDPLNFGSDYTGRVDRFDIGGTSDFEIHVYHKGKEVGIFGSEGWFAKHGKSADVDVPQDVYNNLKGLAVGELRRDGRISSKGTEDITGDKWKRPRITGGPCR